VSNFETNLRLCYEAAICSPKQWKIDVGSLVKRARYGLKHGNKKSSNVRIPELVFSDNNYLRACVRGIFDTDGTVFPKYTNPKNLS